MTNSPTPRLRRTTERLHAAALTLFEERGYEQTTVTDIAAAADVTPMTFYRHFGSKEALVVEDPYDPAIVAAIAAQPAHLPPLTRTVRGFQQAWHSVEIDTTQLRRRLAIITATPSLRPAVLATTQATQDRIADQLRRDGADHLSAEIAAAAAIAALTTALLSWAGEATDTDPSDPIGTALAILSEVGHG